MISVNKCDFRYLSCRIFVNYENRTTFVMQPHLIKNLEDKFGEEVNNLVIMEHLELPA